MWRNAPNLTETSDNLWREAEIRQAVSVGAVYDRAFGLLACENCAVIDRAYSKTTILPPVVQNRVADDESVPGTLCFNC